MRLLVIGNPDPVHVGAHFHYAALQSGIDTRMCDVRSALSRNVWLNRICWRLRDHRGPFFHRFAESAVGMCREFQPDVVLATGLVPIPASGIQKLKSAGAVVCNFLTDDPFNTVHASRWFASALREYDAIFSPRMSNLDELRNLTGRQVEYLPFGYSPRTHFPDAGDVDEDAAPEVFFAGGADGERVPSMEALIRSGLRVQLYGGYWDRYPATRAAARGFASVAEIRRIVPRARVCLCLVRRANRDGHCMRTFELAAMGGCILAEDTPDHRRIFGADGERVLLFRSVAEMVEQTRWLIGHPVERQRMAARCRSWIVAGENSYADRLRIILSRAGTQPAGIENHLEARS